MNHLAKFFFTIILSFLSLLIFAEGTKQFSPTAGHQYYLVVRNGGDRGCFGTVACDEISKKICFEVKSTTEKVYFGTNPNFSGGTYNYQIKKLDGTIVQQGALPTSNAPGFIADYEVAVTGPSAVYTGGYSALTFNPPAAGTHIFDFDIGSGNNTEKEIKYFDITVANQANIEQKGRVWSMAWNFTTTSSTVSFTSKLYPYSADSVVTEISFNGMSPYAFSVSCNMNGCNNTGNFVLDRRSVPGNFTYPQYKVFLNNPDIDLFPSGTMGQIDSVTVNNPCDGQVTFNVYANKPGLVDFLIEVNGIPGYQIEDKFLTTTVEPNIANTILWNGVTDNGDTVPNGKYINIQGTFVNGRTNLPLYDVEYGDDVNWKGFDVALIRPPGPRPKVFWVDTLLYNPPYPANSIELNGCEGSCHSWGYVGDVKTINTWWYSLTASLIPVDLRYRRSNYTAINHIICQGDSVQVFGIWRKADGYFSQVHTNCMGCDSTTGITVRVLPGPTLELGPDQVLCNGASTVLDATGPVGTTYLWSTGETTPTITVNATNSYSVRMTAPNGCVRNDSVHITASSIAPIPIRHN
ncbi:MAG: hypothetical protein LWX70_07245 [Sphingobacteriia bacterium]|nr:hypothetical protein [Sphingobacteriia bacterium]